MPVVRRLPSLLSRIAAEPVRTQDMRSQPPVLPQAWMPSPVRR